MALVFLGLVATAAWSYPVTVSNCGVAQTVTSNPSRAVTMNQGATEFMLAMGLENSMVGTAYLDDAIWPKYATAYAGIPVLSSGYPNETHLMAQNPDFIVASYNSAFRANYTDSRGRARGIFSPDTVGPCTGEGSDWDMSWTTCRPQLHAAGVGTYLFEDACENSSLRPSEVTEETVYEELRALGSVFNVNVTPLIEEMKADFDAAAALVSSTMSGAGLKTVWLDCVDCCSSEEQVFVGAGTGAPNMLMQEAGLTNLFANVAGNWACVNVSEIVAHAPDVMVVVDASWDSAIEKIKWMYNHEGMCSLDVVRTARFVSIPFSATTLSPRNGPAALDLATAAVHVRTGGHTPAQESGVASFSPFFLQAQTSCGRCPLVAQLAVYTDAADGLTYNPLCSTTTTSTKVEVSGALNPSFLLWLVVFAACFKASCWA